MDVLQGHVHISRHLSTRRNCLDKLIRPMGRMGIKQTNPEVPLDIVEFTKERAQSGGADRQRLGGGIELFR